MGQMIVVDVQVCVFVGVVPNDSLISVDPFKMLRDIYVLRIASRIVAFTYTVSSSYDPDQHETITSGLECRASIVSWAWAQWALTRTKISAFWKSARADMYAWILQTIWKRAHESSTTPAGYDNITFDDSWSTCQLNWGYWVRSIVARFLEFNRIYEYHCKINFWMWDDISHRQSDLGDWWKSYSTKCNWILFIDKPVKTTLANSLVVLHCESRSSRVDCDNELFYSPKTSCIGQNSMIINQDTTASILVIRVNAHMKWELAMESETIPTNSGLKRAGIFISGYGCIDWFGEAGLKVPVGSTCWVGQRRVLGTCWAHVE